MNLFFALTTTILLYIAGLVFYINKTRNKAK